MFSFIFDNPDQDKSFCHEAHKGSQREKQVRSFIPLRSLWLKFLLYSVAPASVAAGVDVGEGVIVTVGVAVAGSVGVIVGVKMPFNP